MPKVRYKGPIEEIKGTMYDVVLKRSPTGKTIISKRPNMSNVQWSDAQINQRKRFTLASDYAKAALAEPSVRIVYEKKAKRQHKRPRDLAISDYFKGKDLLSKKQARYDRKTRGN